MTTDKVHLASLNFGWVIDGRVAASASPMSAAEARYLASQGIGAILRLVHEDTDFVLDTSVLGEAGLEDRRIPVKDHRAPTAEQIERALNYIESSLNEGRPVAVTCGAGCGRTGTILACHLIKLGYSAGDALNLLMAKRPCSEEILGTSAQKTAILAFERRVHGRKVRAKARVS